MKTDQKTTDLNRRGFLRLTAGAAAGASALVMGPSLMPSKARAQGADNHRFIFCAFDGGWDHLLSLDPRDPDVFTEARSQETLIQLAWDRLAAQFQTGLITPGGSNISFGPAIGDFARHFDVSCVVRGVSMDTLTHQVGMRYMNTGQLPAGLQATGSSIATRIIAQQGELLPVPNLVSRFETYNNAYPQFASGLSVNGAGDLVLTLRDFPSAPSPVIRNHLEAYRSRNGQCDPAQLDRGGIFGLIRGSMSKAREMVESDLAGYFDFAGDSQEIVELRDRYGISPQGLSGATPAEQAATAYQALKHGVSQCVSMALVNGLDTHDDTWAASQAETQQLGFNALAQLVDDLKADGTLAHTTIVVFSEFGRTAMLNNREGRDHGLSNSILLIGAGVPHNRVIGGTNDVGLSPLSIDPNTGATISGEGTRLTPGNVLASVMQSNGYDGSSLRADPLPCLLT
ncbi:MAG: DUF1501 domain-containing protein [Bradymonadia bacterium]